MGVGLGMPSIWTATSLSFAARKRNVTLLSECTSGEISGGGGVCAGVPATMQVPSRMAMDTMPSTENVRFMSPLIFRKCSAISPSLDSERPRRGMIQQAALFVMHLRTAHATYLSALYLCGDIPRDYR